MTSIDRRCRALYRTSPDGIVFADDTGLVLEWNRSARRLFGGDAPPGSVQELLADPQDSVFEALLTRTFERSTRVLMRGQRGVFWAELYVIPIDDGVALHIRDATININALRALQASYERLNRASEALIEAMDQSTQMMDIGLATTMTPVSAWVLADAFDERNPLGVRGPDYDVRTGTEGPGFDVDVLVDGRSGDVVARYRDLRRRWPDSRLLLLHGTGEEHRLLAALSQEEDTHTQFFGSRETLLAAGRAELERQRVLVRLYHFTAHMQASHRAERRRTAEHIQAQLAQLLTGATLHLSVARQRCDPGVGNWEAIEATRSCVQEALDETVRLAVVLDHGDTL